VASAPAYVGLDVGGSFLKGVRVDGAGRILARLHEPIAGATAEGLLGQLASAAGSLDPGRESVAIGIGLPGIVEREAGRVRGAPAVPVLNGLPVAEPLRVRCGVPVTLENDANAAALAEAWLGAGRGAQSLLLVTLGTGIGGGLVLGGRVWTGRSGYAGEVGHIQVDPQGIPCECGSRGCLETIAGAPGWRRQAEARLAVRDSRLRGVELEPKRIVEAAQAGDAVAIEVVDAAAQAIGTGVAAALDLLNLERVVIGGGVAAAGPFLLERIAEQARRRLFSPVFADCTFRAAELGNDAGALGAARVGMLAAG
jgi:glucokinase